MDHGGLVQGNLHHGVFFINTIMEVDSLMAVAHGGNTHIFWKGGLILFVHGLDIALQGGL